MFAPELWSEVDRFECFWSTTYTFDHRQRRSLAGVRAHFEKCDRLMRLAVKLRPNLDIDHRQLEEFGFSPADNAAELATVIEAAIVELYSCVDCTVKVLHAVYGRGSRGFKESTRGLFQNAQKVTGAFPDELKPLFANAPWYRSFVHLRDELTHSAPGRVYTDRETSKVAYLHVGLRQGGKPLMMDDIFAWVADMMKQVNHFLGSVFHHLNGTLENEPVSQICGMVQGRVLHRFLRPEGEITFDSGACGSWVWFEKPENPTCPFVERCGAYRNKAPLPSD